MSETVWRGCYDDGWRGLIVDEAFAHPAKMARGLISRIFDHLFAMGAIRTGSTVIDPFGGIGTTAIEGASRGCRVVCVELEPKFVDLAKRNFELHRRMWEAAGDPLPRMVQGDSRRLCELLGPVLAECCVSSPPYADEPLRNHAPKKLEKLQQLVADGKVTGRESVRVAKQGFNPNTQIQAQADYGQTPGQLGAMPAGSVADALLSSPPYAESPVASGGDNIDRSRIGTGTNLVGDKKPGYGSTSGNLAALPPGTLADSILTSPPYAASITGAHGETETADESRAKRRTEGGSLGKSQRSGGYGETDGNLSTLPAGDAVVSSPPYEGSFNGGEAETAEETRERMRKNGYSELSIRKVTDGGHTSGLGYGSTDGNISNSTGETFWSAARLIVEQSYAIIKPSGVAVWICKDFVRNKARVPFSDDWRKLCEACGFELIEWIKASLVKETAEPCLFEGKRIRRTERKSFFRRLAEKKGSPRIDNEDVLVMRKPRA